MFNKVATHLLTQNMQCLNDGDCAYRGFNGTKCAIGVLISDEHYDSNLEGNGIGNWNSRLCNALEKSGVSVDCDADMLLLRKLQDLHDGYDPQEWHSRLTTIACESGLSTEALAR